MAITMATWFTGLLVAVRIARSGLAGLIGVAAVGASSAKRNRAWKNYDVDEIRDHLHTRLAEAD